MNCKRWIRRQVFGEFPNSDVRVNAHDNCRALKTWKFLTIFVSVGLLPVHCGD